MRDGHGTVLRGGRRVQFSDFIGKEGCECTIGSNGSDIVEGSARGAFL